MKDLDFNPHKSTSEFRNNYRLHDLAEIHGKSLLIQWGFDYNAFGMDYRYEKVWEKGEDKPDLIIGYKNKRAFLDWKGKHKPIWIVNKRAVSSYEKWEVKFNLPVFICFAVFDNKNLICDFHFAILGVHNYTTSSVKEWDKNNTIEFETDLPVFSKSNILKYL